MLRTDEAKSSGSRAVGANATPSKPSAPDHVNISADALPTAEYPSAIKPLKGHSDKKDVFRVVALPESGLVATASGDGLRIFALDGDGQPLRFRDNSFGNYADGLAALGGDVLACGGADGMLTTWCASTGECLSSIKKTTDGDNVHAIAALGPSRFAVGTTSGIMFFFSHSDGRQLRDIYMGKKMHTASIFDIRVCDEVIVTASADNTTAIWCRRTYQPLAVHRHASRVWSAAVCELFIAVGSTDGGIRVFLNMDGCPLAKVLKGVHTGAIYQLIFVTNNLLLSVSSEKDVAFTCLSDGKVVAVVDVGLRISSAAIMPNGKIACAGPNGTALLLSPPVAVADDVRKYAASLVASP